MAAYYNEIDADAAAWLRELVRRGLVAPGDVDERSISDVRADDLRGYGQCHFFAGIGGWSHALRLAGWPDDRPVWTGSCPCQPFSAAGAQRCSDDERHLWPAFFGLIREYRPATVFGEQVAGAAGYAWWDHVVADLEGEAYAAAACDIGAHSVGAPHIRQRLYWLAYSGEVRRERAQTVKELGWGGPSERCMAPEWWRLEPSETAREIEPGLGSVADGLPEGLVRGGDRRLAPDAAASAEARVMRLRGYGNAIVPQVAAAFIRAVPC
ncbi:MAG: DNA cytosine methyltransferase [Rubrivivax sp.]|nr:DNA cytosine methyltransferase [Rubrivivax sp.]MDH5338781.1 DNA cytosine methyltransferase [Rubrivivax sp.]